MIPKPTSYPANNSHRIALFQEDQRTDADKIDDIGADAIRAAREAMEHLAELPHPVLKPAASHEKFLKNAIGKRRVLNEDYRHAAECMLRHLEAMAAEEECGEPLWKTISSLRQSLENSHRVADLLAVERDILWQRNNQR